MAHNGCPKLKSFNVIAKLRVPSGALLHSNAGEMLALSM